MLLKLVAVALVLSPNYINCLDLNTFYKYLNRDQSGSSSCDIQKNAFLTALERREMWAERMVDAFGRIPSAITQGNLIDLGTYDQCINIFEETDVGDIRGKYCLNGLMVPLSAADLPSFSNRGNDVYQKMLTRNVTNYNETDEAISTTWVFLAACIPDSCLPSDFFGQYGLDQSCQTKDHNKKLDAADIAFLAALGIILLLLVGSTAYDLYIKRNSKEPAHLVLIAFSVYTNAKKIFATGHQPDQILFLNGMKVLSMCWVILFHRYLFFAMTSVNVADYVDWSQRWYATYYWSSHLAVDTFFFISGVLVTYNFLQSRHKHSTFNIFKYYLHRYLRLTPPLAALFFLQMTLVRRIASGPSYEAYVESYTVNCRTNWWAYFLFIQNYAVPDKLCMSHTWYVSVDMQFFILSPVLLIPIARYGRIVSYVVIPILVSITTAYLIPIFYAYDFTIYSDEYMQIYYGTSHSRFPPWLLGIMFGAFIIDYQKKKERYTIKNQLLIFAIWAVMVALMAFLIVYQNDVDFNRTTIKAVIFYPLQKTLWAVCLCWISYACLTGNATFLNWFLSTPFFQVLAKITYSTYLLHVTLIFMHLGYMRTRTYFSDYEAFRVLVADIFIAYMVGAVWTLAFESPVYTIEKVLFGSKNEKMIDKELDGSLGAEDSNKTRGTV